METKTYKLPPMFYADHRMRECGQSGRIIRETKTYVLVELDDAAYNDLRSDCAFYVQQGRAGSFGFETQGLCRSAAATLKRLTGDTPAADTREKRHFTFANPGEGSPRTITTDAVDEAQARRIIKADLPRTADWPLIDPKEPTP